MREQELKKLSRKELLGLLMEEREVSAMMQAELEDAREQLKERRIVMEQVGTMAEATLALNGIFEAADKAAKQYIESIRHMLESQKERQEEIEAETLNRCARIVEEAKGSAMDILDRAERESTRKRRAADEYLRAASQNAKELQENMNTMTLSAC